jgi:hypothetical protein
MNNYKLFGFFLVFVLLWGILFVELPIKVTAQTQTKIHGGIINSDTVWTKAGSPYMITAPLGIAEGTTLTIEPGVVIGIPGTKITCK